MLNPYLCGKWDGTNLWVQWNDAPGGVRMRLRLRKPQGAWEPWQNVGGLDPIERPWMAIPTWREGWIAQVQLQPMAAAEKDDAAWETAKVAEFRKSTCRFSIFTRENPLHYVCGDDGIAAIFMAIVDGAACAYELRENLEVLPGVERQVTLTALGASAWMQLDHPDHFYTQPAWGVVIRNLEPSIEDLVLRGEEEVMIERLATPGPQFIAFNQSNPVERGIS